jgi:hypothetical protein
LTAPLRFDTAASREAEAAIIWYEARAIGLGARFLVEIGRTIDRITHFPKAGSLVPRVSESLGVRRAPVEPYHLVCLM